MSSRTISPLDKIIRKAEKGMPVPSEYKAFFFDEKSKQIFYKEPSFLQSIGKKLSPFFVTANETVSSEGFALTLENGITLNIRYSAKCAPENEERLITALFDETNSFEYVLHQKLKQYTRQYETEVGETISKRFLSDCETEIRKRCFTDTGLLIKPSISFQAEGNLKELNIKSGSFIVRMQDYKHPANLEFEIGIQTDENHLEKCLVELPVADEIRDKIKEIAKALIWEKVTINKFCLYLNLPPTSLDNSSEQKSVKEILINPVNEFLATKGKKIGYLHLSSTTIENIVPKSRIDIEYTAQYKISDENEAIGVKSNVLLKLRDIAAFKKAEEKYNIQKSNSGYIEDWFKRFAISPLIKDILFNKKYKDILLHPESIKDEIKENIAKKAEEIGYAIELHTHLPDIHKLKLRDGFIIIMPDEEFETKSSDIRVRLNVTIKGKISDLEGLDSNLLQPEVDIETEMKLEIRSALEDKIHRMEPEKIYLKFSFDPDPKELPVDEILGEAVTKSLSKKFRVDKSSLRNFIKLSQREDEVINKMAALRKDLRKFEITVYPTSKDSYTEPLVYEIQYKIMGVAQSGWTTFLSRISKEVDIQFQELEDFLRALIAEKLNSIDYITLKSEEIKIKDRIREGISQYVSEQVANKFGLLISFYTFLRKRSETETISIKTSLEIFVLEEEAAIEAKKAHILHSHKNRELLLEQKEEAMGREDWESAREIDKQIEEHEKTSGSTIPAVGNIRKQIEAGKKSDNSLDDVFSKSSKLLDPSSDDEKLNP